MDEKRLSDYERAALREVKKWRATPPGAVAQRLGKALAPVDHVIERYVFRGPVAKSVEAVTGVAMDAGSWTVGTERILGDYRHKGYPVQRLADIPRLVPMEVIDRRVSGLGPYYYAPMGGEGALAGAASLAGPGWAAGALAADVALVSTVSCRAIVHFAAYYGFDTSLLHERQYALTVLGVAGALTESGKTAALAEVTRVGGMIARKKTWEELSKSQLVRTLQAAARTFGYDLTKKKLGQLIFAVGVLVGGGVNTWYLRQVSTASYYAYRERFLELRAKPPGRMADAPDSTVVTAEVIAEEVEREEPSDDDVPMDWLELTTLTIFRERARGPGVIVIADQASAAPKAHDPRCFYVSEEGFREKVLKDRKRNGRYYWARNTDVARRELGATVCGHRGDPLNR